MQWLEESRDSRRNPGADPHRPAGRPCPRIPSSAETVSGTEAAAEGRAGVGRIMRTSRPSRRSRLSGSEWALLLLIAACHSRGPSPVAPRDSTPEAEVRAMARAALQAALGHQLCAAAAPCQVLQLDPRVRGQLVLGAPPPDAPTLATLDTSDVADLGKTVVLRPFGSCSWRFPSDTTCVWMALRATRLPGAPKDRLVAMLVAGGNEPMGLMIQVQLRRLGTGWDVVNLVYHQG